MISVRQHDTMVFFRITVQDFIYMLTNYTRIDSHAAAEKLQQSSWTIVDIRDPASYITGHLKGAQHLTEYNLTDFLTKHDRQQPVLVYCYHGHSSQQAAAFLATQGFQQVFSLDGGFAEWQIHYPTLVVQE